MSNDIICMFKSMLTNKSKKMISSITQNKYTVITTAIILSGIVAYIFLYRQKNASEALHYMGKTDIGDSVQINRLSTLTSYCNRMKTKGKYRKFQRISGENMLLDLSRKIMFCAMPKVASSNWRRIFYFLTGKVNNKSFLTNFSTRDQKGLPIDFRQIHKHKFFSVGELDEKLKYTMLKDFFKFLFVRHPFERITSTWRAKLMGESKFSDFKTQLKQTVTNKTYLEYKNKLVPGVTFEAFVNFIIQSYTKNGGTHAGFDYHFRPMTKLCFPCHIKYDFIGRFDTLVDDSQHILAKIDTAYKDLFPVKGYSLFKDNTMKDCLLKLDGETLNKLYEIYQDDMEAFGYEMPNYLLGKINESITE